MKKLLLFTLLLVYSFSYGQTVITKNEDYLFTDKVELKDLYKLTVGEVKHSTIPKNEELQVVGFDTIHNNLIKVRYKNKIGWVKRAILYNKYVIKDNAVLERVVVNGTTNTAAFLKHNLYKDSILAIAWASADDRIYFRLVNNTTKTISIDWGNSMYVGINGEAERFMHDGEKVVDKETDKSSKIIPMLSQTTDFVLPNHLAFESPDDIAKAGSNIYIFPMRFCNCDNDTLKSTINDGGVKVLLRIRYNNKDLDYTFCIDAMTLPTTGVLGDWYDEWRKLHKDDKK